MITVEGVSSKCANVTTVADVSFPAVENAGWPLLGCRFSRTG